VTRSQLRFALARLVSERFYIQKSTLPCQSETRGYQCRANRLRKNYIGTRELCLARTSGTSPVCLVIWSLWFIWLIWSIWLVWFNQIIETDQIDETDRTDYMSKTGCRTFSASSEAYFFC